MRNLLAIVSIGLFAYSSLCVASTFRSEAFAEYSSVDVKNVADSSRYHVYGRFYGGYVQTQHGPRGEAAFLQRVPSLQMSMVLDNVQFASGSKADSKQMDVRFDYLQPGQPIHAVINGHASRVDYQGSVLNESTNYALFGQLGYFVDADLMIFMGYGLKRQSIDSLAHADDSKITKNYHLGFKWLQRLEHGRAIKWSAGMQNKYRDDELLYAGKDLTHYYGRGNYYFSGDFSLGTGVSLLKGSAVKTTKLIQLVSHYFVTADYSIRAIWQTSLAANKQQWQATVWRLSLIFRF